MRENERETIVGTSSGVWDNTSDNERDWQKQGDGLETIRFAVTVHPSIGRVCA